VSEAPRFRGPAARAAFRCGCRDVLPTFPATIAWGLVTGVAMAQSGLSLPEAYGLAVFAYAGSAQLAALPLLTSHAPVWVTVLTALMVNLRFVIYSAAMKQPLGRLPFARRLGLSYLIGDIPFVLFARHAPRHPAALQPAYFLGIGAANFVAWHTGSFAGLFAAGRIPAAWGLDFAGMVALVALLVPMLATAGGLAGCLVAGVAGVLLDGLPARAGLLVATLLGVGAALAAERLAALRR
jgi:predicted branched-subunit amino acid permease